MKYIIKHAGFYILLLVASLSFWQFNFSPLAFYAVFSSSLLIAFFLERYIPFQASWNMNKNDMKHDIVYAGLNILVSPLLKIATLYLITVINSLVPIGNFQQLVRSLPVTMQIIFALLLSGFLPYWYHRISHTKTGFLWKLHSTHHASERLYWLNALRFHPLNAILNIFMSSVLLLLFGFTNEVILFAGFLNNYVSIFNHSNIDFRLGVFNYIFNMNEIHRWHHSRDIKEANNNYSGGALIFWDIVFGTYYNPAKTMGAGDLGLFHESKRTFPYRSILKQLCYPFCRCRR
jgi:ornithine lipid hydroxylase